MRASAADPTSKLARAKVLLLGALLGPLACTDEFPLGGWDPLVPGAGAGGAGANASGGTSASAGTAPSGGNGATSASGGSGAVAGSEPTAGTDASGGMAGADGTSGAGGSGGPATLLPACNEPATPGPLNQSGSATGTTDTISDFVWPAPMDSLEWDLRVETPLERDGYYWMNQVSFTGTGTVGYFGMQERGGYYLEPGDDVDFVKMVVFWISSPGITEEDLPGRVELGDITAPDGRALPDPSGNFITIHAKFEWEYCRAYRLRLGLESNDATGERWIGGWILDVDANVETFFGRILLPADAGQFVPFNSLRTTRVDRPPTPMTCAGYEYVSALFGWPTANLGTMVPDSRTSHFPVTTRCGTSRFTFLPTAIRHELAVER